MCIEIHHRRTHISGDIFVVILTPGFGLGN